jgi:phosphoenolpyruvate synthase/pyruvate phosphate dikinase
MNDVQSSYSEAESTKLHLLRFSDIACQDPGMVGAKAATLAHLFNLFPGTIPPGFVVPVCQNDFFINIAKRNRYDEASQSLLAAFGEPNSTTMRQYAVRSSRLDEDPTGRSFSGQYKSTLGLGSVGDIINAITACVRSAVSVQVSARRRTHGQRQRRTLGVLIQEMIPADCAGVAFTLNPVTGRNEVVIEARFGLGDLIANDKTIPDEIIIDSSGRRAKMKVGSKRLMSVLTSQGVIQTSVPKSLQTAPCLSGSQVSSIVIAARACEAVLGHPVDMEWALCGNKPFILRVRPVGAVFSMGWPDLA